jgi:hypothetical protein
VQASLQAEPNRQDRKDGAPAPLSPDAHTSKMQNHGETDKRNAIIIDETVG